MSKKTKNKKQKTCAIHEKKKQFGSKVKLASYMKQLYYDIAPNYN
jgi:hypothetical protein